MFDRSQLQAARRIVVKVGTSTLTHPNGKLNFSRIEGLVRELADAVNSGKQILLVSSGAVGAGMDRLGWREKPKPCLKSRRLPLWVREFSCIRMRNYLVNMGRSLHRCC